eukprot:1715362-Prymnesium_polylepis.1
MLGAALLMLVTPGAVTSYATAGTINMPPAIARTVPLANCPYCMLTRFTRRRARSILSMEWSPEV